MAQGVLPLIGYNYASGNYRRMKKTVMISTALSVGMASICMVVSLIFSNELIGFFIPQQGSQSHEYGEAFLRIMCIGAPFSACAYAVISFFQATGKGIRSLILALLRKGILDIPLMFILNGTFPVYGIVWATPIADMVCCGVAIILFVLFLSKHKMPDSVGLSRETAGEVLDEETPAKL